MATEIPIANLYYLLCYAWKHAQEKELVSRAQAGRLKRVQDLLGTVLARGTARLLKRGIDRDYREVREDLRGIRGKLDPSEMAKRALRSRGLAACEYEELSVDVLHNRILLSTLDRLRRLPAPDLDPKVRAEVRSACGKLAGVRLLRLHGGLFNQVQLDRSQRIYRFLLSACRLAYGQLVVEGEAGNRRFVNLDARTMHKVFENFARGFYNHEQSVFKVNPDGRGISFVADETEDDQRKWIPGMEADVILESSERRIILDTKYYQHPLSKWRKLHSDDLYQLLAYLRNRYAEKPAGPPYEGMLLYPQVDADIEIDVRLEGFDIRARTIDLSQHWRGVHGDMLALVGLAPTVDTAPTRTEAA